MSIKAVKKAYKQICEQYHEMVQDIKDFEKEAAEGLVEPERVDRLKDQIAPIKQNYERWAYIMYLLNQPNRKSKHKNYEKRNLKFLKSLDKNNSIDATFAENEKAMKEIGR